MLVTTSRRRHARLGLLVRKGTVMRIKLCSLTAIVLLAAAIVPRPVGAVRAAMDSTLDSAPTAQTSAEEARIRQVTENLLPVVQIKGDRSTGMNLADRMRHYAVPGVSIAVINQGRIEWARGFGVKDTTTNQPVTSETLFQAGSISKPVSAAAALHLVQEGKLDLDENVNDRLKSWKLPDNEHTEKKKVTLREILSHTAGLTVHGFPGYAADAATASLVQVLDGAKPANTAPIRVEIDPGTEFSYSGGGYAVMQQLLIDVTGKPFPEILDQNVLSPVGMTESTYQQPLPQSWQSKAASGHVKGKPVRGRWHVYPEMSAAGLWTTPSDLARFAIEIQRSLAGQSNRVLSASMTKLMETPVMDGYGLGLAIEGEGDSTRFGHSGDDEGFQAQFIAYEKGGWGAVVMTNGEGGSGLAQEIIRGIAKVYAWPSYPFVEKELVHVDPREFAAYAGTYSLPGLITATVRVEGNKLIVRAADGVDSELNPEAGGWFFLTDETIEVQFEKDANGQVTGLTARQGAQTFKLKKEVSQKPEKK
jgi:CubicO group peptidase (beta-lactamase class C family)